MFDPEKSFAVSRNGFKIKHEIIKDLLPVLHHRYKHFSPEYRMIILDGELMPWSALGTGLIENSFKNLSKVVHGELEFLQENNFYEEYKKLEKKINESNFKKDKETFTKKKLMEKYNSGLYSTYSAFRAHEPIEKHIDALNVFDKQIKLYGDPNAHKLDFKAFDILKMIKTQNDEIIIPSMTMTPSKRFTEVSSDTICIVDTSQDDWLKKAEAFFNTITFSKHMEGVVLKAETNDNVVIPFLKVRNKDYLTIVYGYDYKFKEKYQHLIKQKNTKYKLKLSYDEYKLGLEMLMSDPMNDEYKQLVANMIFNNIKETNLDPRL